MCLYTNQKLQKELKQLKKEKIEIKVWKYLDYDHEHGLVSPVRRLKYFPGFTQVTKSKIVGRRKYSLLSYSYGLHFYLTNKLRYIGNTRVQFIVQTKDIKALGKYGDLVCSKAFLPKRSYLEAIRRGKKQNRIRPTFKY